MSHGYQYIIHVPIAWVEPLERAAKVCGQLVENFIVGCIGEELARIEAESHEENDDGQD